MNPLIPIFQKKIVQDIFQRVLYVWAVRHPASGYVQGINDLMTPFFTVFLTEYSDISNQQLNKFNHYTLNKLLLVFLDTEIQNVDIENLPEKDLRQLEADSYWCMTKLLERIQENYVFSQPGIQRKVQSLEDLIKRIDSNFVLYLLNVLSQSFKSYFFEHSADINIHMNIRLCSFIFNIFFSSR